MHSSNVMLRFVIDCIDSHTQPLIYMQRLKEGFIFVLYAYDDVFFFIKTAS